MPSQTLVKTWQVQNSGAAAWPPGTKLVYMRGNLPSIENEFDISAGPVAPGQVVDVSAVVRTPQARGRNRALFRLVDPSGAKFGPRLWCDLRVGDPNASDANNCQGEQQDQDQHGCHARSIAVPLAPAPSPSPSPADAAPVPAPVASAPYADSPAPSAEAAQAPPTAVPHPHPHPHPLAFVPEDHKTKFKVQLEALAAMGWDSEELNLYLLQENDGNVQRVCNWLLEQMKD